MSTIDEIAREAAMREALANFNRGHDLCWPETQQEEGHFKLPGPNDENSTGMILQLDMNYDENTRTFGPMEFCNTGIGIPNAYKKEFITTIRQTDSKYESRSGNSRSRHAEMAAVDAVGIGAMQNRSSGGHYLVEATNKFIHKMDPSFDGTDLFWSLQIEILMTYANYSCYNGGEEGWLKGYFYLVRGHQEAHIDAGYVAESKKARGMTAWVPQALQAGLGGEKTTNSDIFLTGTLMIGRKYEVFTVLQNLSNKSFLVTKGIPVKSEEEWKRSQAATQTKAADAIIVTFEKAMLQGVRSSVFIDWAEIRKKLPEKPQESPIGRIQSRIQDQIQSRRENLGSNQTESQSQQPSVRTTSCSRMFVIPIASVLVICMYATWTWNATLIEWNNTLTEWNNTLTERNAEVPVTLTLHQQIAKAMEGPYGLIPKNQDKNSKASTLSTRPQEVLQNKTIQGVQAIPGNEIFQEIQVAPQSLIFQEIQDAAQNKAFLLIENNGSSLAFFAFAVAVLAAIFGIWYCLLPNARSRLTPAVDPPGSTPLARQSQHSRAPPSLALSGVTGSSSMSEESASSAQGSTDQQQQLQEGCVFLVHHQPEAACNPRCEVFQRKLRRQPPYEDVLEEIDVEAALQTVLEMLQNGEVTECTILRDGVVTTTSFKNYRQAHAVESTRSSASLGDSSVARGYQQAMKQQNVNNGDTTPSTPLKSKTVSAIPGSPVPKASDNEQEAGNSPESDS